MKKFPVALQLYSVRDDLAADFAGTLKKVKELGYDGVEFAGLYDHSPAEVKALCEEAGLIPISAHVPFVDLMADIPGMVADYKAIGCEYIAIPYLTPEYRPGNEKFNEVLKGAAAIGEECKKQGLVLLYHNHDFEFEKVDGEYALDLLYRVVPKELLETELDTCWVKVAGECPAAYIRKYAGRAPVVHLKDFYMPGEKPEHMYSLVGLKEEEKAAEEAFGFRPVGKGMQNFPAIMEACEEAGAQWVVVEQDAPALGLTPMECAAASREYLKSIGY